MHSDFVPTSSANMPNCVPSQSIYTLTTPSRRRCCLATHSLLIQQNDRRTISTHRVHRQKPCHEDELTHSKKALDSKLDERHVLWTSGGLFFSISLIPLSNCAIVFVRSWCLVLSSLISSLAFSL